jgi:hypothetical protein
MVPVNGGRTWRLHFLRTLESWKAILGSQKPNQKKAERQPKQESTYSSSCGVLVKGELLSMKMLMMG